MVSVRHPRLPIVGIVEVVNTLNLTLIILVRDRKGKSQIDPSMGWKVDDFASSWQQGQN